MVVPLVAGGLLVGGGIAVAGAVGGGALYYKYRKMNKRKFPKSATTGMTLLVWGIPPALY